MIRRLILDWPTRRSRNVIGISPDAGAGAARAVRHLDLEDITAGVDAVERDAASVSLRHALNPPVRSCGRSRGRSARRCCRRGSMSLARSPVDDATAVDVARPDDEVRRAVEDRAEEGRQRRRVVRPVGVHLDDGRRAAGERPANPSRYARPRPCLAGRGGPGFGVGAGQLVSQLTGPVGRAVVDHEERRPGRIARIAPRWGRGSPPRCRWAG